MVMIAGSLSAKLHLKQASHTVYYYFVPNPLKVGHRWVIYSNKYLAPSLSKTKLAVQHPNLGYYLSFGGLDLVQAQLRSGKHWADLNEKIE